MFKFDKKIVHNSKWMIIQQVYKLFIGVGITAIIARYFGPEIYGKYNYALSFTLIFTALSTLGLENLTVKDVVDKKYDEGTILGTSFFLRLSGGIVIIILSTVLIRIVNPDDLEAQTIVLIISIALLFRAFEVIEYWIQAYQRAKLSSLVRIVVYTLISFLSIMLVISNGNITHYAMIYVLNVFLVGLGLFIVYTFVRKDHSKWHVNLYYAKRVLSKSWFLILSGIMATLYMQMDKIMLGTLMPTTEEVGIYSVATQISTMWYFIPMAIIVSFRPVIMSNKKQNEDTYNKSLRNLYSIISLLGIVVGIGISLISSFAINILYGAEYATAAGMLSISVWAGTFATLGSARAIWLIIEGLQKYAMVFTFFGAIVNFILNLILIPIIGGYGASLATLISQFTVAIIIPFVFKETRKSAIMLVKSFNFKSFIKEFFKGDSL